MVRAPLHTEESSSPLGSATTRTVVAEAGDAGERLDRVLALRLAGESRTRLKRLIEAGHAQRDGVTIRDPSARVKSGELISITIPEALPDTPLPQAIGLDIRFEDQHLIVLDKPAGMVVHPAPGNPERTLVNALLAHCGDSLAGIGGVKRPGIVHRLDKDTSGLMVVAKTELAHTRLAAAFAAHDLLRAYRAVVWGVPHPLRGEIAGNIGRSPTDRKKMAVVRGGGRAALTRYETVRHFGEVAALVECRLATGRTHQIRVHMTERGHPLIGDPVYGRRVAAARLRRLPGSAQAGLAAFGRQALHSHKLGFRHPASAAWLEFVSDLPSDMDSLLRILDGL
jgi:23S rRNA pseudouridine1911/1915/1917 synthase